MFESNQHTAQTAKNDPFITNALSGLHLTKQNDMENSLTRSVLQFQQLMSDLEVRLTQTIQTASAAFLDIQLAGDVRLKSEWAAMDEALANVKAAAEWDFFKSDTNRTLSPETPLRDASAIVFPQQDHHSIPPVMTGSLDRQKSLTKSWAPFHFGTSFLQPKTRS